jgi:hypothetical protein
VHACTCTRVRVYVHAFSRQPPLRPCHTIAHRTSVCQRMKNITRTPVYAGIRYRGTLYRHRLYTFQARSRTVAYAAWHTARKNIFLSMFKNFVRIRGTPDVRYSYAGISKDFCAYENYFINFHTLLIRFSHTQHGNSVTGP